ncbi:MAG: hypothetical protein Q9200_002669 [Gallowayella weberi]
MTINLASANNDSHDDVKEKQLIDIGQRLRITFNNLKSHLASEQEHLTLPNALENASQRFDLWAVNLGLYVTGHSSLEYRLGDAPLIYNYAKQALADLQKYLDIICQGLQEQSGDRTLHDTHSENSEDSEDKDFGTYQDDIYLETALGNVNDIIDKLYQLSFKILNPVTRLGFSKAQNYREIDQETGVDLIQIIAGFDRQHIEHVFMELRKSNSIEDIQNYYLVKRLAKANTRRRQQFKHWRARRIKIEASSNPPRDLNLPVPSSNVLVTGQKQLLETPMAGQPAPSMPSTAIRLDPAIVNLDDTTSIISTSTYARLERGHEHTLEIPQLPKKLRSKKEFEYADQQFDSFKQWHAHEINDHRLARECVEHPGEIFRSLQDWREHIASYHMDSLSTKHLEIIANDSGMSEETRSCPICSEQTVTPEHVGVHLQQLALFALPRSTGLEDDLVSDNKASVATADDLGRDRGDDSDMLSLPNENGRPPEAVYGVDFNDVGNVLADLDPHELASDKRHIDDDWSVVYNPKLPRQLSVELKHSIVGDSALYSVRFSSDGQYVAVGSAKSAAIYHVETGAKTAEFKLSDFDSKATYVRSVCFDPSGDYLSTASNTNIIGVSTPPLALANVLI